MQTEEQKKNIQVQANKTYGFSTYSLEEIKSFSNIMNKCLQNEPDLAEIMPLSDKPEQFFQSLSDGIVFCKLINSAKPGTIDERAVNKKISQSKRKEFQELENLHLAISAAKSIGCVVVNIHAQTIKEGQAPIVLGILWQILKIKYINSINLQQNPLLAKLKSDNETIIDLTKFQGEQLLLRWINYHLVKNNCPKGQIKNFNTDLQDGMAYVYLLNSIDKTKAQLLSDQLPAEERIQKMLNFAHNMDINISINCKDILDANQKLNLLFCAQIFEKYPVIEVTETEKKEITEARQEIEVEIGTREERTFVNWINSMGIEQIPYVVNLYADLADGLVILYVLDKVSQGIVEWKKVCQGQKLNPAKPDYIFKKTENCQLCVEYGKKLQLKLVNTSGKNLVESNKKENKVFMLGYVWQLMRFNLLQVIGESSEEALLKWGNQNVPQPNQIKGFTDKTISTSQFLLHLLSSIDKQIVNWEFVNNGESSDEKKLNAQYAISIGRKLGASLFLVWEDITEVKQKMILAFVASLKEVFLKLQKKQ